MPACVPISNNNVTDVNANKPPPGTSDSKLHRIMACLFWKKKTDVVDMKKESIAKKQKLTVDRSERSRRVLKMESMKEVPTHREPAENDVKQQSSSASKQMFLPSENPTASFLSYLNPSVRRACSDVIKTASDNTTKPKSKEAFIEEGRPVRTRNTNYRGGQRATDREPMGTGTLGKTPKVPIRSQSQTHPQKKPIVVPGTMTGSDDDIGYNSDNDIDDLHEEMRRMNLSQPDLRNSHLSGAKRRRRREGSISVSEDSDGSSDNEDVVDPNRPQNPVPAKLPQQIKVPQSPTDTTSKDASKTKQNQQSEKRKSMEQVIDALFQQTQNNLDTIYQNGLEQLEDIETFRAETATPETCMRRLEEQLRESSDDDSKPNTNGAFVNRKAPSVDHNKNKHDKPSNAKNAEGNEILEEYAPEMDGLLTEVSVWAKDRQTWLLNDKSADPMRREDTSVSFNDRVIDHVTRTNDDKCTEWVESQKQEARGTPVSSESKMNGILTGPKLFRSTSKTPYSRRVSFSESDSNQANESNLNQENIRPFEQNIKSSNNMSRNGLLIGNATNVVHLSHLPGFGRQSQPPKNDEDNFSLMYCDDRSTIDDNLSDMDQPNNYRTRSPDSWISSIVSYPHRANHNNDNHNDSFEGTIPSSLNAAGDKQPSPAKRSASSPAKSHQIVRIAPKIYTPFSNVEKPKSHKSLIGESKSFSTLSKPMIRNTQLRPLPASRPPRPMEMLNQMSGLESLSSQSFSGTSNVTVYRGSRNMLNDLESKVPVAEASPRPYSEIPLRATSLATYDKGSSQNSTSHEPPQYAPRPASETVPMKRVDKIGMGHVMATNSTKERNKYARDIVNSLQKQRMQPQSAFEEPREEKNASNSDSKDNKHKRHKVFNNSLLKGGYTYDKHSRTTSRNSSTRNGNQETVTSTSPTGNLTDASISQLHLSVADSFSGTSPPGNNNPISVATHGAICSGDAAPLGGGKLVQSHTHGISGQEASNPEDFNKTAARFKRLRSRRDQEIEWLMKDAAETEV